jgi:hypothetical protein
VENKNSSKARERAGHCDQLRANSKGATPNPEHQRMREDQGLRQMMTTYNSQMFFRIDGNFSP